MKYWILAGGVGTFVIGIFAVGCGGATTDVVTKSSLGKDLFFDTSLSNPVGQSCGTCHSANRSFTDPRGGITSEGILTGIFGSRQSSSAMYMSFSPEFAFDPVSQDFIGGQFWDGRAKNLEEQAKAPFLNPGEMHNSTKQEVVDKVRTGAFATKFQTIYGNDIFNNTDMAFDAIADAIATFERTTTFQPFTSKYDSFLKGKVNLTASEARGLAVYENPAKGNCAKCHPSQPGPNGEPPLFTNFKYDNIGVPRNLLSPFYTQPSWQNPDGTGFIDVGLSKTTGRPQDAGRFKIPTLRNIAVTAPYFHNGVFTTLEDAILFYDSRDLGGFAVPEVLQGVNRVDMGSLHLTEQEKLDLIEFLKTLTDGF
jgi:cytochrome c peroxidase